VQFTYLALQRKRSMRIVLTPSDNVAPDNLARPCDELAMRIALRQFPGVLRVLHDVGITNIFAEMTDARVESNHACQRRRALDFVRRRQHRVAIQNQAVQTALGDSLHNCKRTACDGPILDNDVLQFKLQEVLDDGFVLRLDFDEIRKDSERRPVELPDVIEELLNRFGTVGSLDSQFAN